MFNGKIQNWSNLTIRRALFVNFIWLAFRVESRKSDEPVGGNRKISTKLALSLRKQFIWSMARYSFFPLFEWTNSMVVWPLFTVLCLHLKQIEWETKQMEKLKFFAFWNNDEDDDGSGSGSLTISYLNFHWFFVQTLWSNSFSTQLKRTRNKVITSLCCVNECMLLLWFFFFVFLSFASLRFLVPWWYSSTSASCAAFALFAFNVKQILKYWTYCAGRIYMDASSSDHFRMYVHTYTAQTLSLIFSVRQWRRRWRRRRRPYDLIERFSFCFFPSSITYSCIALNVCLYSPYICPKHMMSIACATHTHKYKHTCTHTLALGSTNFSGRNKYVPADFFLLLYRRRRRRHKSFLFIAVYICCIYFQTYFFCLLYTLLLFKFNFMTHFEIWAGMFINIYVYMFWVIVVFFSFVEMNSSKVLIVCFRFVQLRFMVASEHSRYSGI